MRTRRLGALAAVLWLVAGCSAVGAAADATADGSGGELQGSSWVLQSYASNGVLTTVPDDQFADAEFRSQRVKGFGGCNDFDAVYRTGGRMLLVGRPITTLMFCGEATSAFESAYLALLQQSRSFNVRGDTLTIRGPDLAILLVFEVPPRNPLLGSWIVDSFASAPGTVTAPLEGTELTAVFRFDKVAGSSGCNTFQGPYTTNGDAAVIGPLAMTRMACPAEIMAQETAFLAALQGVARVESRGQTLQLQDRNGSLVVALIRPSAVEPAPSPSASPSASASAVVSPSPSPSASPTTDADRQPDAHADTDTHPDTERLAGADHRPTVIAAAGRELRGHRAAGRAHRHDRLPGCVAHGDHAAHAGLSLLRPEPDHGAGRSDDAADGGDGQDGPDRVLCRRADRGHQSDCMERPS